MIKQPAATKAQPPTARARIEVAVPWYNHKKWSSILKKSQASASPIANLVQGFCDDVDGKLAWVTLPKSDKTVLLRVSQNPLQIKVFKDDSYENCLAHLQGNPLKVASSHMIDDDIQAFINSLLMATSQTPIKDKSNTSSCQNLENNGVARVMHPSGSPESSILHEYKSASSGENGLPWYSNLQKLYCKAGEFKQKNFEKNVRALKQALTEESPGFHRAWMDINKTSLLVETFETDEYEFHAIPKTEKIPEKTDGKSKWHVIKFLVEAEDALEICMQLRISLDGNFAELVYVKATGTITGTLMLEHALDLADKLGVKNTVLLDDAKDQQNLPIRVIKPVADFSGNNWYAKYGFGFYPCENLSVSQDNVIISQDPTAHKAAVNQVKGTPIQFLKKLHKPAQQRTLDNICKRHDVKASTSLGNLADKVLKASRKPSTEKRGKKDLLSLYNLTLNSGKVNKLKCWPKDQEARKVYREALADLTNFQLMIRPHH